MKNFLQIYHPENCIKAPAEIIAKYEGKVPDSLIELWTNHGFGKYKDGLLEIINPDDFNDALWMYLGREVEYYVPFATSAFGELFYYRMLTDPEDLEEGDEVVEDVCVVEIHHRVINTCAWSLDEFFNDYLCDPEVMNDLLRRELYQQATKKLGYLAKNEAFYFVPALCIGGAEDLKFVDKGNIQTHLKILFELGRES